MSVLLAIFIICNVILRVFAIQCKKCVPEIGPTCKNSHCFNSNKCLSELSSVNNTAQCHAVSVTLHLKPAAQPTELNQYPSEEYVKSYGDGIMSWYNGSIIVRTCAHRAPCGVSINTGNVKHSIICCKSNRCNNHTMPEPKNGMECYGCADNNCRENVKPVPCTSNQKFCAWGYFKGPYNRFADLLLDASMNMSTNEDQDGESRSVRFPFRGCASAEVCGIPISTVNKIRCCCGKLCNKSVSPQYNMLLLLVTGLLPSLRMPM